MLAKYSLPKRCMVMGASCGSKPALPSAHSCGAGDLPLLCRCGPGTAPPALVGRLLTGSKTPEVRSWSMPSGVTHLFTCLCLYGMRSGIKEIKRITSIQKCHRKGLQSLCCRDSRNSSSNNSFSAPSWSLLCQCRIELWNYSHGTYFFLFFTSIPSLLLLGISNNLYKYCSFAWKIMDKCNRQHTGGGRDLTVHAVCRDLAVKSGLREGRGHVEPVTWLW